MRMCPNLKKEIESINISAHECSVRFYNGSVILALNSSENIRGMRSSCLIIDESRLVPNRVRSSVLRPFLNFIRPIPALNKPEYKHLEVEPNVEIAITSSWYKDTELWDDFNSYLNQMTKGLEYFVCGFAYSLSVHEGLLSRKRVEQVRSEDNFDQATFDMEYNSLFGGSFEDAYYKIDEFQKNRTVERAFIPMSDLEAVNNQGKRKKQYPLQPGEIRVISADIALMQGSENDNTIIDICRLIPRGDYYERQYVYTESCNGQHTDTIALRIKRLYYEFDCSYVALDAAGSGLSIFDALVKNTYDKTLDVEYPMWNCINDDKMAERGNKNALKCIYSIKATPELNHVMHNAFKSDLGRGKIQLLVDDVKAKELYSEKTSFLKLSPVEQGRLLKPYLETTIFINETISLEMSIISGGYIKLSERSNKARKDRYSSRLYNNYVARILEKKNLNPDKKKKRSILDAVFFI